MVVRLLIVILVASAACGAEAPPPSVSIDSLFYPAEVRRMVADADSLQVATLRAKFPEAQNPSDFEDVEIRSVTGAQRETLLRLLFTDATYSWRDTVLPDGSIRSRAIFWLPSWTIRVRAQKGREVVEMAFCFFTMVHVSRGGVLLNTAFMGPKSDELLALFRTIFPENAPLLRAEKNRAFQKGIPWGGK